MLKKKIQTLSEKKCRNRKKKKSRTGIGIGACRSSALHPFTWSFIGECFHLVLCPVGENLSLTQNVDANQIIPTRIAPYADFLHALQLHSKVSKNPLRGFTIRPHNHDLDLMFLNS
jgi:hypothetical protein